MARLRRSAADWATVVDRLQRQFNASPAQGVLTWIDEYANALGAGNIDLASRLTTEQFPFLPDFAVVVARYLQPGIDALRRGQSPQALDHLSLGSTSGADAVRPLLEWFAQPDRPAIAPDAARHDARGFWLEAAGLADEAVNAYSEAGRFYGWDRNIDAAVRTLERAIALDPTHVDSYWYLADAQLAASYVAQPPYADATAVERALAAWNRGSSVRLPDAATSWAYVTRTLINEQLARLRDADRVTLWWEGAGFVERALILDNTDAFRWALLARLHRLLGNEATALHAAREALRRNPDDAAALEEHAAILANTGAFEEAEASIERRIAQDAGNLWARGVKAFLHLHRRDYPSAIASIDEALAADPQNLWNLDVRAMCSFLLGDVETARAIRERIWQRYAQPPALPADDRRICAMAAYHLGHYDDAIAILEPLAAEPVERGFSLRALGQCYLAKGQLARGEELFLSGLARANARELDDVVSEDLSRLEITAPGWLAAPGGLASVSRVRRMAYALVAESRRTPPQEPAAAAEAELQLVLQSIEPDRDPEAEVASRGGLARLQTQNERWVEATRTFDVLPASRFPEAKLALRRAFQQLGEARWKTDADDEALGFFRKALAAAGEDKRFAAAMHCRLALVQQHQGDSAGARYEFVAALQLARQTDPTDAAAALAATCRPLLRRVDDFWAVDSLWESLQRQDPINAADFAAARTVLTSYLDDVYNTSKYSDPNAILPLVIPVVLEVGTVLVPLVDPKSDGGKFISRDISAMRDGIRAEMGLSVPGIRVRENPALGSGYSILIDEVSVAQDTVHQGFRYYPVALADLGLTNTSAESVLESPHPATGLPGCWCREEHWDALTTKGVVHLTETDFMLAHIATILRRHLANFLGVEEVVAVVADIKNDEHLGAFITRVMDSGEQRLAFARVLRALVREQVPIADIRRIVACVQERGLDPIDETVRAVRLKLSDQLPGNQPNVTLLQLPDWAPLVRTEGGRPVLAVSPATAHTMLLAVRRWLETRTAPIALITPTSELRPLVRRLIEYEFPAVSVLSLDELTHPDQVVSLNEDAASVEKV